MSAQNLQLSSIGRQDFYLSNDDIDSNNFLDYKYNKYVNFAISPIKIISNETINFGRKINFEIPMNKGDFLNKIYFYVTLPIITQPLGFEEYIGWANSIMNTLVEKVTLTIGRVTISEIYGLTSEILNEYSIHNNDLLVGRSDTYRTNPYNALQEYTYYFPLTFWFNKDLSQSLPLILMKNSTITLTFYLRDLSECIVYNINNEPTNINILSGGIIADYIFVDNNFKKKFYNENKLITRSYLIEQENMIKESISDNKVLFSNSFTLNHPVKVMYIVFVEKNSENNNDWFNFGRRVDNSSLLKELELKLDGLDKYNDVLPEHFFRLVESSKYFDKVPNKYIYCISFCKNPTDINPSGSINMSNISDISLRLTMNNNNPECNLYLISINYNIIKIKSGYTCLAFMD